MKTLLILLHYRTKMLEPYKNIINMWKNMPSHLRCFCLQHKIILKFISPTKFSLLFKIQQNFFCSHRNFGKVITTKFCSCHDNCVVVTCAKICSDQSHRKWNTTERIWIQNEISSVRWLPDYVSNVTGALTDFCLFWWRLWNSIPYHDYV